MKVLYIYHHLGLGDSFICNGIVREFAEKFEKIKVFSKEHNYETIKFMYSDNLNIEVIPVSGSDQGVYNYINKLSHSQDKSFQFYVLKVGFENLWANASDPNSPSFSLSPSFDVRFYEILGLDFNLRFNKFKVQRDIEREKNFFNLFEVEEKKYIFVHDDERFKIDINKIEIKDLKIIKPDINLTPNMFDYCYLIENAKEVHTIESSFQFMIDSLELNSENYAHRYPRYLTEGEKPIYKTVKKIIF
jgi:hypothetical protein